MASPRLPVARRKSPLRGENKSLISDFALGGRRQGERDLQAISLFSPLEEVNRRDALSSKPHSQCIARQRDASGPTFVGGSLAWSLSLRLIRRSCRVSRVPV
jgi:hypothetical protein